MPPEVIGTRPRNGCLKAGANRLKGIEGDTRLPPQSTGRAIDEYRLSLLWSSDRSHSEVRIGLRPDGAREGANAGQDFFAYSTNYLIDVENAIIVEATTAIRQAAKRMMSVR